MNEYEVTYLSNPELSEDARGELDAAIDSLIGQLGGAISASDPNNRRRLFYPIKKQTVGFSRTVNVTLDASHVATLRESVGKQNGVLRVALLKTPRRNDVSTETIDEYYKKALPAKPGAEKEKKESKPVTMEEVEEKIEEALDEEVK
jgi:ribosomal protein S6